MLPLKVANDVPLECDGAVQEAKPSIHQQVASPTACQAHATMLPKGIMRRDPAVLFSVKERRKNLAFAATSRSSLLKDRSFN